MMFIEVFVPAGTLGARDREMLAAELIHRLTEHEDAPPEVTATARALTQVVVHQPEAWWAGDAPVNAQAPRYVVRLSVHGSWLSAETAPHFVDLVTSALAGVVPEGERIFDEPLAWVHIVGLREGGLGAFGRSIASDELTRMMTSDWRASGAPQPADLPEGVVIDPVCGMRVQLDDRAITHRHDGTVYGFCHQVCRKVFIQDLGQAKEPARRS